MGTFDNVPTGRILYHEGQDVCYDVLKLIIFINDRTDDVNYIFPVRSIQIDFDFMKVTNLKKMRAIIYTLYRLWVSTNEVSWHLKKYESYK